MAGPDPLNRVAPQEFEIRGIAKPLRHQGFNVISWILTASGCNSLRADVRQAGSCNRDELGQTLSDSGRRSAQ